MVQWHTKSRKKTSGGKRTTVRRCDKKKAWMGGLPANTKTSETSEQEIKTKQGRGSKLKKRTIQTKYVNVVDKKTGKVQKLEIIAVKENNANRLFARSNITTKGAIIRVKSGNTEKLAKVTNRPGQDGNVNAELTE
ncbi:MAG: 30S ribosomal protein S8e [Candidatus Diapherotrites archaeon]|jgi:small subunit ribosomal protein S8e|uniref:30S ribosomal protein S8e n=1 Tax=Candidatus Iainarchaeum sp. TaxID=3101447 RepID=A0A7K4BYL4_9ARCH|nr:30S ribosomal protein S8e [Candidatus Diapherotrites archaeon]